MANAFLLKPQPIAGVTATSTGTGAPINMGNDYAGVVWASQSVAGVSLMVDLGADRPVDTIMMFGLLFPSATTMVARVATSAQGNLFNGGDFYVFGSGPIFAGTVRLASGAGVSLTTATGLPAIRYLRIDISPPSASIVQISRLVVGARITPERNFGYGGNFGVRDLGSLDFSARGVLLRRRGAKLRTVALTFSNLRKDEVENSVKLLLEQIGNTEMIALVTDPAAHAQRETRSYYGPLVGDFGIVQRNSAGWEAKINMVSVF